MSGSEPEYGNKLPVEQAVDVKTIFTPIRDPQIPAWSALDFYRITPNSAEL